MVEQAARDLEKEIDVLHRNHPDVLNATSVLTVGSSKPGTAFRQENEFELIKPNGKTIAGKSGDYVLVFKVPDGIELNSELIESIKENGIPSKDYWISIIDADIFHQSYSTEPVSPNLIGAEGLSFHQAHQVYKASGLEQKAFIPKEKQTKLTSLESAQANTYQDVDDNELVMLDVEGNPYPKWASQFLTQFKPDPSNPESVKLFESVKIHYGIGDSGLKMPSTS